MWVLFLKTTSQPFADQPPFPALTRNTKTRGEYENTTTQPPSLTPSVLLDSQYVVVPEHTDGLRALLGGDQAELHSDGFVQRVLQQLVVVVDGDTDHRGVDDRTFWYPEDNERNIHD